MEKLKTRIVALPTITMDGETYLSYEAVTDTVAAFLYPERISTHPTDQMGAAAYQRVLETADSLCRELGYMTIVKLTPPEIPLDQMGLYRSTVLPAAAEPDPVMVHVGPGRVEMMQDGLLLDVRLNQLGLDEVTRQHFKIPVTASNGVIDLMQRAVASDWPNDYRGVWHDIVRQVAHVTVP